MCAPRSFQSLSCPASCLFIPRWTLVLHCFWSCHQYQPSSPIRYVFVPCYPQAWEALLTDMVESMSLLAFRSLFNSFAMLPARNLMVTRQQNIVTAAFVLNIAFMAPPVHPVLSSERASCHLLMCPSRVLRGETLCPGDLGALLQCKQCYIFSRITHPLPPRPSRGKLGCTLCARKKASHRLADLSGRGLGVEQWQQ